MLQLTPVVFENYDCVQAIIANVLKHHRTPWQMMFLGVMGFEYIELDEGGFKIHTGGVCEEVLNEIYGIYEEPFVSRDFLNIKEAIRNDDLLCLYIDGFDCPWHNAYKKHHIAHYLLAVGLNDYKKTIICADPFFSEELKELAIQEDILTRKNFIIRWNREDIFDLKNIYNRSLWCLKNTISNMIRNPKPYWETINDFSLYLSESGLQKELFSCDDNAFNDWIISLNFLSKARNCFVEALSYVSRMYSLDLNDSINDFEQLSKDWLKLKLYLLKQYYKSKKSCDVLQHIKLQIRNLAEKEKTSIYKLNECLRSLYC